MAKIKSNQQKQTSIRIKNVYPKTPTQKLMFEEFLDGFKILALGLPGTGKSYLSIYLALKTIFDSKTPFEKLIICRSVVPSRDMGFLPGSEEEKIMVYKRPYINIVNELLENDKGWELLESKGKVEFVSTSFLRGCTFDDSFVFVDEIQNLSFQEIHTVMTRISETSDILIAGDFEQNDLDMNESGVNELIKIAKKMESFKILNFDSEDIVRSGFIKEYILAKNEIEKQKVFKRNKEENKEEEEIKTQYNGHLVNPTISGINNFKPSKTLLS